jgi:hypothetical protein
MQPQHVNILPEQGPAVYSYVTAYGGGELGIVQQGDGSLVLSSAGPTWLVAADGSVEEDDA